jgi:tRNA pseudouridine38-40 synthase
MDKSKLRNIKLVIEYEGTNYFGWQSQRHGKTIQSEIVKAIEKVTGQRPILYGAGRTDSGVHALGQVANFRTESEIPVEKIPHALNAHLPKDITIYKAQEVSADFNAQFDVKQKSYKYTILNRETPMAYMRNYYHLIKGPLDVEAMRSAALHLIGRKDFAAFTTKSSSKSDTVREITKLKIERQGDFVLIYITGDGFLYNMVRAIAGTLVQVGQGKLSPDDMVLILKSRDRRHAGPNLPAKGLCLLEVTY